ncbi:MAG: glycosyltransferase family 4 protein [Natronohydrobacter sp.]|nr:glycosyltransferase family 4 protein [Natronohydrobacter sp.]
MRIGYLMNTYPVTSATFIRREIAALEGQGVQITRFAVRAWDQALVDPLDQREATLCTYLLAPGGLRLGLGALREAARNPRGMARALAGAWTLWRNAGRGALLRHIAYLLEAVELKRRSTGLSHIHAHFSTNTAAVALLCARLGGPGYSFTAHGPDEFVDPTASSLAEKIHGARFVVAITHYARTRLALAGGMAAWDKLHVVRCGVDLATLTPAPPPDPDAPLLCIGRLCPQKAQALLVAAMARLRATHPNARLVLIGDGDTRPEVEAAIRAHGLDAQIDLRGWADNATVSAALAQSRALVLPSFAEGLPIVIMEAFARARPVISTYIAGIPELVDDRCGWLVPAGDVDRLAQALAACLDASPDTLAAMGSEGRVRVTAAHDLQTNAAQLRALFARAD